MDEPENLHPMPRGNLPPVRHLHDGVHAVHEGVCAEVGTLDHRDGDHSGVGVGLLVYDYMLAGYGDVVWL
jgi:hypothetical protein